MNVNTDPLVEDYLRHLEARGRKHVTVEATYTVCALSGRSSPRLQSIDTPLSLIGRSSSILCRSTVIPKSL